MNICSTQISKGKNLIIICWIWTFKFALERHVYSFIQRLLRMVYDQSLIEKLKYLEKWSVVNYSIMSYKCNVQYWTWHTWTSLKTCFLLGTVQPCGMRWRCRNQFTRRIMSMLDFWSHQVLFKKAQIDTKLFIIRPSPKQSKIKCTICFSFNLISARAVIVCHKSNRSVCVTRSPWVRR